MTTTAATRDAAAVETWVSAFAAGWRDPSSPEAFIEHFAPLLDPDVRMIQPQIPDLIGLEAFRTGFVEPIFGLIPDLRGTVRGWASDGNVVWIELELEGTVGGRTVRLDTVDRITLRDGLAVERKAVLDPGPLLAAVARSPRSWPRFVHIQAAGLRRRLSR